MPLFEVEVIHTVRYKKRVRAKDEQEAQAKGEEIWLYAAENESWKYIADERGEVNVYRYHRP